MMKIRTTILLIIGLLAISGWGIMRKETNEQPLTNQSTTTPLKNSTQQTNHTLPKWMTDVIPKSEKEASDQFNILILGTDERKSEPSRADVLMVANVNPKENSWKIISFMRDLYVPIADNNGWSKLNHAYAFGGEDLVEKTIEDTFGVQIDYKAKINFEGFARLAADVFPEGYKTTVTQGMIDYFKWDLQPGEQTLKGQQILEYVRYRDPIKSDFGRVERQQQVLADAVSYWKSLSKDGIPFQEMMRVVQSGRSVIKTNVPLTELVQVGLDSISNSPNVELLRIPTEGTYVTKRTNDGLVLDFELSQNVVEINKFWGEGTPSIETTKVILQQDH
ncbi:LCP family protein [Mangrovibacillus cuniculi]|uniref:LCP family protein n=1 Tax=Mangrovibacillus cuniculi TaxID=2593652 RepID=A0A7S8CB81_9BACI|nr:LCP family protein [Mangrovibacillus cuniculi]QPC46603.1 LCP family protein [Mangrovibacillus cuniculi]